jgi:putative ABC transport system permease protein
MLTDWLMRVRSLFRRRQVEQELDDELRFHLERQVESYVREGLTPEAAARRARLEFGGIDQIKEEHRDARGIGLVADLDRDIRYAARQLRRSPGFAALAILCLGLGIGVNTAIFGVINSVLLRPMPVAEPDRLVRVGRAERGLPFRTFLDFRERTRMLSGLAAAFPMESDLDVDGDSSFVVAEVASSNYADVLGVNPSIGRWFADDREPAAVISYAIWERHFNRDPQVIGRHIWSESQSYMVVGVAPPEFTGVFAPLRTDIWVPIRTRPSLLAQFEEPKSAMTLMLFGRLRDGTTARQGAAELNAIDSQLLSEQGSGSERLSPVVVEAVRGLPNSASRGLAQRLTGLLAAIVGLVLLIACVNVGNLLLVRGAIRQREFAVRRALGASRFRLLRQLLIESLLIAVGGGICGVILAMWTNRLLEMSLPSLYTIFALQMDLSLDWRVMVFATIVSLITTVLCGLLPAWRTSRTRGLVALKGEVGGAVKRRRPVGLVAQVAMSLVLLFVSGSFVQALVRLQSTDPGFDVDGRLYAYTFVPSPPFTPEHRRAAYTQAMEQLRALPGVRRVGLTSILPLLPIGPNCVALPEGQPVRTTSAAVDVNYFDTMGIDIVSGRSFSDGDVSTDTGTVIVNETLARRVWPHASPIGERVTVGCNAPRAAVVVGVVRDSVIRDVGEVAQPHFYRPFVPEDFGRITTILIATTTDANALVQPVRETLRGLGEGSRVYAVRPLADYVQESLSSIRWITKLMGSFGTLALLLAAVGLYGMVAYRVTLRTQEIGLRMALGADRTNVFREVLTHGFAVVVTGVVIGELLTVGVTRLLASVQEGLRPAGLTTHVAVALIWVVVALVACALPAERAARVDPLAALRHE